MSPRNAKAGLHLPIAGTYWLAAVAGLTLTGLVKNINLILVLAYFLLGLFVVNWWAVRRALRGLVARRLPCPAGFAGEFVPWRIVIDVGGAAPVGWSVHDTVAECPVSWAPEKPAATHECVRLIRPKRRGVFSPGPGSVNYSAPFGLIEARRPIQGDVSLTVFPRRGRLRLDRLLQQLRVLGRGRERRRSLVRQLVEGVDVHGLRPYRPGDSPRWVHWRTTARKGELMVREFESGALPGLFVVVDGEWLRGGDPTRRFEAALEFLTTLVWDWSVNPEGKLILAMPGAAPRTITDRAAAVGLLHDFAALDMFGWAGDAAEPPPDYRYAIVRVGAGRMTGSAALFVDPLIATEWYEPPGRE